MATDDTEVGSNSAVVKIGADSYEEFGPIIDDIKNRSENISRISEKGIVNEISGASIVARDDGQVNMSSSEWCNYKLNPGGKATEISIESVTLTNKKSIEADDISINKHKINPALYELADFRSVTLPGNTQASIIGNLTTMSMVLVKAWEPNLGRYVLIRRMAAVPIFSQTLNLPEIPSALKVNDSSIDQSIQNMQVVMKGGDSQAAAATIEKK